MENSETAAVFPAEVVNSEGVFGVAVAKWLIAEAQAGRGDWHLEMLQGSANEKTTWEFTRRIGSCEAILRYGSGYANLRIEDAGGDIIAVVMRGETTSALLQELWNAVDAHHIATGTAKREGLAREIELGG